jgi:hypothetical protein
LIFLVRASTKGFSNYDYNSGIDYMYSYNSNGNTLSHYWKCFLPRNWTRRLLGQTKVFDVYAARIALPSWSHGEYWKSLWKSHCLGDRRSPILRRHILRRKAKDSSSASHGAVDTNEYISIRLRTSMQRTNLDILIKRINNVFIRNIR